jgi:hypothetical protein
VPHPVIILSVGGDEYEVTAPDLARLTDYLRTPHPYGPDLDPGAAAVAVYLERLMEDGPAENPPLTTSECAGMLLALGRMEIQEGLPAGLAAVNSALLRYLRTTEQPGSARTA